MHILVAETDSDFLHKMQHALQKAGYEVSVADNGMTAWQHLTSPAPPDLLVTRFRLSAGKPPGTALGAHAYSCQPPIPVVYIPANVDQAKYADPEHGIVLIKPFNLADLVATVRHLLDARKRCSE